jgi:hypothetical protein
MEKAIIVVEDYWNYGLIKALSKVIDFKDIEVTLAEGRSNCISTASSFASKGYETLLVANAECTIERLYQDQKLHISSALTQFYDNVYLMFCRPELCYCLFELGDFSRISNKVFSNTPFSSDLTRAEYVPSEVLEDLGGTYAKDIILGYLDQNPEVVLELAKTPTLNSLINFLGKK